MLEVAGSMNALMKCGLCENFVSVLIQKACIGCHARLHRPLSDERRERIATAALQGLAAHLGMNAVSKQVAVGALLMADTLIAALDGQ
jgi:cbb3-type cytochrome oxidase cytochrome c subunit